MPPIKASKTPARKHAHISSDDLRTAYECLARVEILEGSLAGATFVDVTALTNLARQQLAAERSRNAAGLLRAAEHICFAALAPEQTTDALVPAGLKASIATEFENLTRRAEDHWVASDAPANRDVIATLYGRVLAQARAVFARGAWWAALELARAAEALSRIGEGLPAAIPDPGLMGRLAS